ncbi:bifunctional tetrahydrofolate synthase/dihydrofolate synthase [Halomonas sp. WWR20]
MSTPLTLSDWLAHLERQHPVSIDLGLERVVVVARRLGLLERRLAGHVVTVAGTNGKGSTVAMLEALARAHGHTTAAYTSPHLLRYNERLRLDGLEASDTALVSGFERVEAARLEDEPVSLTYFEAGTLAALWLIGEAQPDVAILEVGLGGRLDAVNVVDADVAVITTIAQDHADFLGTDLEGIGREKAGILRGGHPVVLGSESLPASVHQVADALGAPAFALGRDFLRESLGEEWRWHGVDGQGRKRTLEPLPDPGLPLDNAATALQAFLLAGFAPETAACVEAFEAVGLPGRMQWRGPWCLDVGHNPHAAHYLATQLARRARPARRIGLLGMLGDKDAAGVIAALAPVIDAWVAVGLEGSRARSSAELAELLQEQGQTLLHEAASPAEGTEWLRARLTESEEVLVCGSFYTVAGALECLMAADVD